MARLFARYRGIEQYKIVVYFGKSGERVFGALGPTAGLRHVVTLQPEAPDPELVEVGPDIYERPQRLLGPAARNWSELRQAAASETFDFEGDRIAVTCSLGACTLTTETTAAQFIRAAQELMLRAKKQGKNRVCS